MAANISSSLCQFPTVLTHRTGGPPLSLQELLETQWQQTAQFILDQAGRQNNGQFSSLPFLYHYVRRRDTFVTITVPFRES